MAGDTRHTSGYNINSRTEKKVFRLGEESSLVLATVGFGADAKDLAETMKRAVDVNAAFQAGDMVLIVARTSGSSTT